MAGILRRISIVSVYHQITVRLNITEHSPDYVALSLAALMPHVAIEFYVNKCYGIFRQRGRKRMR